MRLLALTASLLLSQPALALDPATLVDTAIDAHVLPGFAALTEATGTLKNTAAEDCSNVSPALRAAYHQGFDAWMAVSHLRFGPTEEDAKPVQWIVEQLTQNWGNGASWHLDNGTHPHEAHYLKLDCSKARATLGWQPHWNFSQALQTIIVWHKAHSIHQSSKDMRALCLQQIKDYSTSF